MAIKFPSSLATKQTNSQKSEYSPQATATCDSLGFYCVYTRTSVEMEESLYSFILQHFTSGGTFWVGSSAIRIIERLGIQTSSSFDKN